MKNIFKLIGLATLILFSFFYTDKVITVIKEQDPIMIKLDNIKEKYKKDPINSIIDNDTIIPGINGVEIDLDKSYKKMKSMNKFSESLIEYKEIKPLNSIENNKNKYIIKGNPTKQAVSLLFIINNDKYLNKIEKILFTNNIKANFFIDYNYLIKNTTKLKSSNIYYYSYGNMGNYTPDNIIFSNNLISRITNNKANYCLVTSKDIKELNICSSYDLYTILPNIISTGNPYNDVKSNLTSGSIILLNNNIETIRELELIINYIKGKGLIIDALSNLLSE